ncbi:hypothetical protein C8R47DRAFT_1213699 [Mycena vitilis]|nr:hypothetical protein C8R47DRAFT_1213699 [Mycena vitilis]
MSQDSAAQSLLSLSIAAAQVQPIPLPDPGAPNAKHPQAPSHHRRLSSTGRRRRLSDARDAATRPLSVGVPALSMAALSLSTSASPPPSAVFMPASAPAKSSTPIPIAQSAAGRKKRGVDHKCESCSKIYRHPSCLIKHRWEHTPHWRTLSSLPHTSSSASGGGGGVLSKHAQVQLLEAAAILSHLSPDSETGTSLPEDRGMWPRWVSGGTLEGEEGGGVPASASFGSGASGPFGSGGGGAGEYALRSGSAGGGGGPRMHDYEVPRGAEVRAGVVEVPHARNGGTRGGGRYGQAMQHSAGSAWSVPRSVSVSASVSSEQSRSRSTPSDDEELEGEGGEEGEGEGDAYGARGYGYGYGYGGGGGRERERGGARVWKREEEDEFGFEFDLGGVREEEGEAEEEAEKDGRYGHGHGHGHGRRAGESLRWGGMEEMDDIDMDMD